MKIKVSSHTGLGGAVLITPFVGFGDLLYHTPTLRILSRIYKGVDVWCFNPEPFMGNPYINKLFKFDAQVNTFPHEFYFDFISELSSENNFYIKNIYPSNIYSPEYYSLAVLHCALPNDEKHLTYNWSQKDIVSAKIKSGGAFSSTKITTVINPSVGWPSRTLPLEYYREMVAKITEMGDVVLLVGKEVNPLTFLPTDTKENVCVTLKKNEIKSMHPIDQLLINNSVIDLTNKLSLPECAALYSLSDIAINTENGNMVISGTNDHCWNLYIPTLTAPQYRVPYRKGSQEYRTTIVYNKDRFYPGSDFAQLRGGYDYVRTEVQLPTIESILDSYKECREIILKEKGN
jgi:hypothetical protein